MGSIVLPAAAKQTATMIFLHGIGDSGASWAEILPALVPPCIKLILPHASIRPVTLNQGVRMPAWFDLRPLDQPKDSIGIKHASTQIQEIIHRETKSGIPENQIILGGFSQGGALALYSGLTGSLRLAGILALSTWLPLKTEIDWSKVQNQIPVLQCHGDQDQLISLETATKTARTLKAHLSSFTFKMYPGLEHTISSAEELKDISEFIEIKSRQDQNQ